MAESTCLVAGAEGSRVAEPGPAVLLCPAQAFNTGLGPGDRDPAWSGEAATGGHEAEQQALCCNLLKLCWCPRSLQVMMIMMK